MPNNKSNKQFLSVPDEKLIVPWPKNHEDPQFFMHMRYKDAQDRTEKGEDVFSEMIMYKSTKGSINIIDMTNEECLPEHREILKGWDTTTYLPTWCDMNGVPWRRFARKILRYQIHSIRGTYYSVVLEGKLTKRRCSLNKNSPLAYTNTIFRGF